MFSFRNSGSSSSNNNERRSKSVDEPTNKLVIPFSHSSSTKPQTSPPQVKTSSEDDHPGDNISITRSDGITHDILSVFQKPGINEVINTSTKAEYSPVKSPELPSFFRLLKDFLNSEGN